MDVNTILYAVVIIGQLGLFFFFKERLKMKERVIQDLQTLMDTTDIKRLAEYFKKTDELREKALFAKVDLSLTTWYLEHHAQWGNKFDEIASFTVAILEAMPEKEREEYINATFPKCKEMLIRFFQDGSSNIGYGFFDSVQVQPNPSQGE